MHPVVGRLTLIESIMEFIEGLKQHQLYKQFDVWAEKTSTEILTWAHPEMDLAARPESVRNAPLASFQAMFAFVVLYAIIVFVGMVLYKKPKASAGGKRETPSWDVVLGSFKKEPVKIFQAIYNVVQVRSSASRCKCMLGVYFDQRERACWFNFRCLKGATCCGALET